MWALLLELTPLLWLNMKLGLSRLLNDDDVGDRLFWWPYVLFPHEAAGVDDGRDAAQKSQQPVDATVRPTSLDD